MNFSEFLDTVPSFAAFNRLELDLVERAMIVDDFPDDHEFIEEGKSADSMYLIVEGEVIVSRRRLERLGSDELARLHPGDVFGLVTLIDHGPSSASCTAAGPVKAACLPRSAFNMLFKGNAYVGYQFQHLIAHQLVEDIRMVIASLIARIAEQPT